MIEHYIVILTVPVVLAEGKFVGCGVAAQNFLFAATERPAGTRATKVLEVSNPTERSFRLLCSSQTQHYSRSREVLTSLRSPFLLLLEEALYCISLVLINTRM